MAFFVRGLLVASFVLSTALQAQTAASLRPYVTCHFDDGLTIVAKEPTPSGAAGRTAITLLGPREVPIARGEKVQFAYTGKDPFARVLVEQLPTKSYAQGKADLLSAFDKTIASDDNVQRNYTLKPTINGFEAHGLDRKEIVGAVMGIYLLADDTNHTVISIDFLHQQPADNSSFGSMEEYVKLRDAFLTGYSSCVRANLRATVSAPPAKATATKGDAAKRPVRRR